MSPDDTTTDTRTEQQAPRHVPRGRRTRRALGGAAAAAAMAALPLLTAPGAVAATPAPAQYSGSAAQEQVRQVVRLTNAERVKAGCQALTWTTVINRAAQGHANWMNQTGTFSHTGKNGSSFADRMRAAGYDRPGGENIAAGQRDAQAVVTAWMNSPGHRANILNCRFTTIGAGVAGARPYWVQNFGY